MGPGSRPTGDIEPAPREIVLDELASNGEEDEDRVSAAVGTGLVTAYISRGVLFANEVLQPYVTLTFALPELQGGVITDASIFAGSWGSVKLGSPPPDPAGRLTRFYETDLYAGASVELAERWAISATYYRYESLSEAFEGYNDLELIVRFEDSGAWEGAVPLDSFTLSPALRVHRKAAQREDGEGDGGNGSAEAAANGFAARPFGEEQLADMVEVKPGEEPSCRALRPAVAYGGSGRSG